MLDLRPDDPATFADGRERTDVRVRDLGPLADNRRTADDAVFNLRPALKDHLAVELGLIVHGAIQPADDALQNQSVRVENILELASVLPPSGNKMRLDIPPIFDQILDRVRDLELIAPGRFDGIHRVEDIFIEQIDADEGQIAFRLFGLFDEPDDPSVAQLRDAEQLRIGDFGQKNEGIRSLGL